MSTTTRPDPHPCPDCRLTYPSRQALRRHGALDHRPAPDGAWLTGQLVDSAHPGPVEDRAPQVHGTTGGAVAALAGRLAPVGSDPEVDVHDAAAAEPPTAASPRDGRPTDAWWLPLLMVASLMLLSAAAGPVVALLAALLVWSHAARRLLAPGPRRAAGHHEDRSASPD